MRKYRKTFLVAKLECHWTCIHILILTIPQSFILFLYKN
ncbi:hypothetical protein BVRB_8g181300 [Beta vulgaris subsp. vulgaris]|nr:hypothetical protein BVRB_8g181300 [Beta vulgaris subsp. vulgaris]